MLFTFLIKDASSLWTRCQHRAQRNHLTQLYFTDTTLSFDCFISPPGFVWGPCHTGELIRRDNRIDIRSKRNALYNVLVLFSSDESTWSGSVANSRCDMGRRCSLWTLHDFCKIQSLMHNMDDFRKKPSLLHPWVLACLFNVFFITKAALDPFRIISCEGIKGCSLQEIARQ